MEEGELPDTPVGDTYDPAFEWPGETTNTTPDDNYDIEREAAPSTSFKAPSCHTLRLLVAKTSILPRKQKLIIPDSHTELQFGRDVEPAGSETPRIRLKEMEVSKVHATIYWDKERDSWGIVDMGSKHGTFVKSSVIKAGRVSLDLRSGEDMRGARLSPVRVASVPRRLYHLDSVTIGSTTFVVHIHEDRRPCVECTSGSGSVHQVPLFSVSKQDRDTTNAKLKRTRDAAAIDNMTQASRDPKKALTMLKRSLLTRHDSAETVEGSSVYVDRSARRRTMHPGSHLDTPGVPNPRSASDLPPIPHNPYQALVARTNTLAPPRPAPPIEPSQPPAPLPDTNIGHRLLMKQGWQPGTSLGLPDGSSDGLIEPIQVSANAHRAGLGVPAQRPISGGLSISSSDWREDGKQRRWDGVRG
jgi:pSer/pThr/pTyr-binding forkhead associated (FHA) protein